jgi:hypothetical protein
MGDRPVHRRRRSGDRRRLDGFGCFARTQTENLLLFLGLRSGPGSCISEQQCGGGKRCSPVSLAAGGVEGTVVRCLRDLVDLVGIEPTTSSMPWKRAPSCATGPHWFILAHAKDEVKPCGCTSVHSRRTKRMATSRRAGHNPRAGLGKAAGRSGLGRLFFALEPEPRARADNKRQKNDDRPECCAATGFLRRCHVLLRLPLLLRCVAAMMLSLP